MLIVTDDGSCVTQQSAQTFSDNRRLFGVFVEARVYHGPDGALLDGRFSNWQTDLPDAPAMVLVDERGNELWLSGTPCGHNGQGPSGAEKILLQEGFGDAAKTVRDKRFVRVILRKGSDGTVNSELTERNQALWDGNGRIVRWLWRQRAITEADRAEEVTRLMWDDPYSGTT